MTTHLDQEIWICDVQSDITMGGGGAQPVTQNSNTGPPAFQLPFLAGTGADGKGGTNGGSGTWSQYFNPGTAIPGAGGATAPSSDAGIPGALPFASALYQNYAPSYFPGQTYAPETAAQSSGLDAITQLGLNGGTSVNGAATNFNTSLLNGNFLNSNPGSMFQTDFANGNAPGLGPLEDLASGKISPELMNSITMSVMPGVAGPTIQGNSTNNPASMFALGNGVATGAAGVEAQAASALGGIESSAASNLGQNFNSGLNSAVFGLGEAPTTSQMPFQNLSDAINAGTQTQGLNQGVINDAVTRFNYGQTLPYNLLDQYLGSVNGNFGSSGSLTTPTFNNNSSTTGGLLGSLGGAGAGALAGTYVFPGVGTAAGALIGGMFGGSLGSNFSDRRLKRDIVKLAATIGGLPLYVFRYVWSSVPQIGFMADDVMRVKPHAVHEGPFGFAMVDLAAAME